MLENGAAFLFRDCSHDVQDETIGFRHIRRRYLYTRLKQVLDESDVAGEAIQLGDQKRRAERLASTKARASCGLLKFPDQELFRGVATPYLKNLLSEGLLEDAADYLHLTQGQVGLIVRMVNTFIPHLMDSGASPLEQHVEEIREKCPPEQKMTLTNG